MNFQKGWDYVIHLCVLGTYTTNTCGINVLLLCCFVFVFCFLVYLLCQVQAISIKLTFVHQMSVFFL